MIGYRVISDIERPSKKMIDQLKQLDTTLLADGAVTRIAMNHRIKRKVGKGIIAGPAFTVKLPLGDSLLSIKALEMAQKGDVIVIDASGSEDNAVWGDMKSLIAKKKELEGAVIDGSIRDINECQKIDFPLFSNYVVCSASTKNSPGEINVSVSCGDVVVNPGDIIVGDENGVVVIPKNNAKEIVSNAEKKKTRVEKILVEINKGNYITKKAYDQLKALGYE